MLNVFESVVPSSSPLAANSSKAKVSESKPDSERGESFDSILNQQRTSQTDDASARRASDKPTTHEANAENQSSENAPNDSAKSESQANASNQEGDTATKSTSETAIDQAPDSLQGGTEPRTEANDELGPANTSLLAATSAIPVKTTDAPETPQGKIQSSEKAPLESALKTQVDLALHALLQPAVKSASASTGLSAEQLIAAQATFDGLADKSGGASNFALTQNRIIPQQNLVEAGLAPVISGTHANFDMDVLSNVDAKLSLSSSAALAPNLMTQLKQGADTNINVKMQSSSSLTAISGVLSQGVNPSMSPALNLEVGQSVPSSLVESLGTSAEPLTALNPAHSEWTRLGTSAALKTDINVSFGRAEWNTAVADKVMQMASRNLNFAEIQLDPPELGPLQVRVSLNNEHASVSFTAASAQVRDALEQGQQRLKEMFGEEGFDLVDVDVSDQQLDQNEEGEAAPGIASDGSEEMDAPELQLSQTLQFERDGVDAFA